MREYSFADSRTTHSVVNVYTDSNDPRTIGNVAQEKVSSVVTKWQKGFNNTDPRLAQTRVVGNG